MDTSLIRRLLDAVPIALILVGPDYRVMAANPVAAEMFGEPLEGRSASAVLRHPEFLGSIEACLDENRKFASRIVLSGANQDMHLALTVSPFETAAGRCAVVAFEDLTALEQTAAMRRDFVANVSHELRTPLTALVGFIETLRGAAREDAAARERFLGIMDREAGRMIRLVSDLLSLSRVEAEERRRPVEQIDLLPVLRSVLATHRDQAAAAGVALSLDAPGGAAVVRADADQMTQVFHNLIENAIKYGGSGGTVEVRVVTVERDPVLRGAAILVEVSDHGEGIDPLHLPRLTERFYRVDSDRSREKGGTGLGLAIVKHIINRHRGRMKIESEVGKGSRFMVILPVE